MNVYYKELTAMSYAFYRAMFGTTMASIVAYMTVMSMGVKHHSYEIDQFIYVYPIFVGYVVGLTSHISKLRQFI